MRIIQIIDSLEAGGAERMAVNYANAFYNKIEFSGLVVSRKQGPLLQQLNHKVGYLFLNKKSSIDIRALSRLRWFVKKNRVDIVHAHGTSFFLAVLLKLTYPQVKIVWHEHYGARVKQSKKDNFILLFSSLFFSAVFVVNHQLEAWVKQTLGVKKVFCVPNFVVFEKNQEKATILKGEDRKRIVCLANLKKPKNHIAILASFKNLKLDALGWSLHLIGKDYEDSYSFSLKYFIEDNNLEKAIFTYGSRNDVQHILSQATIGILASTDEGFPLSLLEYGLAQLAVVSTNVGYCSELITENRIGLLFDPSDTLQLQKQLQKMVADETMRNSCGSCLHAIVLENYSQSKGVDFLISNYRKL
jgi:glycosyltransferase involved in cell wall biosynthesis